MCLFRIHVLLIPYVTPRCIDRCNRVHRDLIKKLPCWDVHGTLINGSSMVKGYNQKILLTSGLKPCTIYPCMMHNAPSSFILRMRHLHISSYCKIFEMLKMKDFGLNWACIYTSWCFVYNIWWFQPLFEKIWLEIGMSINMFFFKTAH